MKRLVVYLMAGADTPALAETAVEGGADLIEIGFPFSDPLADGPTIRRAAERALAAGVARESLLIDPAHDFEKTTWHSLEITRRLDEMVATGWPVLVSLSNKDFVGETLGLPTDQRLTGTLAATAVSRLKGASIFRVHEATETRQVIDMVDAISGLRPPRRAIRGLA